MTTTPWVLKGTEYGNCNCDYGCPCQFNGRPSAPNGDCRYALFTQIDEDQMGKAISYIMSVFPHQSSIPCLAFRTMNLGVRFGSSADVRRRGALGLLSGGKPT